MPLIVKPFRFCGADKLTQSALDRLEPGELAEVVDPDGGPSQFIIKDRSGHMHELPLWSKLFVKHNGLTLQLDQHNPSK